MVKFFRSQAVFLRDRGGSGRDKKWEVDLQNLRNACLEGQDQKSLIDPKCQASELFLTSFFRTFSTLYTSYSSSWKYFDKVVFIFILSYQNGLLPEIGNETKNQ